VAAYGDVDELNAAIGVVRSTAPEFEPALLQAIRRDLFSFGGHLAATDPDKEKRAMARASFDESRVTALEAAIDSATDQLAPLRAFILPGGSPASAGLHVARTVCRRAERSVVHLAGQAPVPELFIVYLNRLSDLLFTLARLANKTAGVEDVTW
jgi:cob(I)alamin adenosyltransferase